MSVMHKTHFKHHLPPSTTRSFILSSDPPYYSDPPIIRALRVGLVYDVRVLYRRWGKRKCWHFFTFWPWSHFQARLTRKKLFPLLLWTFRLKLVMSRVIIDVRHFLPEKSSFWHLFDKNYLLEKDYLKVIFRLYWTNKRKIALLCCSEHMKKFWSCHVSF